MNPYIIIGKIGSTYGVHGWLKLFSYTECPNDILAYHPWYIEDSNEWKIIERIESKKHEKIFIIKFSGINNPEQARLLTGKKIAMHRSQLPALKNDEYYWSDLEGLKVINQKGTELGTVVYILETGSNDVLIVKGETEYAIPFFLHEVIVSIDLKNRIMKVNWE